MEGKKVTISEIQVHKVLAEQEKEQEQSAIGNQALEQEHRHNRTEANGSLLS